MLKSSKYSEPPSSEITPEAVYLSRRKFMKAAGLAGLGLVLAACAPEVASPTQAVGAADNALKDELGNPANSLQDITHYNNYYEFSQDKGAVAGLAEGLKTDAWQVEVSGLVAKPQTFGMEDLLKRFPPEERVYRLRCVEAWSMVIPWSGFPLASLLKAVEPSGAAKYVRFVSAALPDQMPGVRDPFFGYPYTEGLRLDEALNDLTLLVTGLYGKPLPNQDGAPLRLMAPWKYGFKSAKALVKIELTAEQPKTFWSSAAPREYGFYANVNPGVDHPRWSQSSERRIGAGGRQATLLFNGYAEQVAQMYTGLDLNKNY